MKKEKKGLFIQKKVTKGTRGKYGIPLTRRELNWT